MAIMVYVRKRCRSGATDARRPFLRDPNDSYCLQRPQAIPAGAGVPVILANLWAEDLLHRSRLNTVENYLRDIAIAYEWALSRGSPLEAKLERLAVFSSAELTSLAERLCSTKRGAGASQSTCTRRLEAVKSFIDFSFEHYVELNRLGLLEQSQAEKNKAKNLRNLQKNHQDCISIRTAATSNAT